MRIAATILALVGMAACGGDSDGVNGSFAGSAVTLTHAYSQTPSPDQKSILVTILDRPSDCQHPQNDSLKNMSSLSIEVFVHGAGGDSVPAKAGTFQIVGDAGSANPDGNDAVVGFDVTDATCTPQLPVTARSGKVTLENLSPPSGTVDAVLPTGERFSGRFTAAKCDPPPGPPAGGTCF